MTVLGRPARRDGASPLVLSERARLRAALSFPAPVESAHGPAARAPEPAPERPTQEAPSPVADQHERAAELALQRRLDALEARLAALPNRSELEEIGAQLTAVAARADELDNKLDKLIGIATSERRVEVLYDMVQGVSDEVAELRSDVARWRTANTRQLGQTLRTALDRLASPEAPAPKKRSPRTT